MNANAIAVLRFFFENANSQQVLEAIEATATGKYYAPDTSLLKRAQPGDLLCYATIRDIAEKTNLTPNCARDQVKKLRNTKKIESEQLWVILCDSSSLGDRRCELISAQQGELSAEDLDNSVGPGANLYRILEPHVPLTEASLCKLAEQLTLPFPPNEKTILAQRARILDPFFAPAGERP